MSRATIIRGYHAEADALRNQAKEIVEYIADHAGISELCASFLDLPQVRKVMRIAQSDSPEITLKASSSARNSGVSAAGDGGLSTFCSGVVKRKPYNARSHDKRYAMSN